MNLQAQAIQTLRDQLFFCNGVAAKVTRAGNVALETKVVPVKRKTQDADLSSGATYVDTVDILFDGRDDYSPVVGDSVELFDHESDGETASTVYVVKQIQKELWRWDDPYKIVRRVHVQRRS